MIILMISFLMMGVMANTATIKAETLDVDEIEEDKVYEFTGEEIVELANYVSELETRVELQQNMIENLEEQVKEYDNKTDSYENEIMILEEKIVNLQSQIDIYEARIEQQERTFEEVMTEVDRTIELYEEGSESLEESLEYYREETGVSMIDRAQWILIGAGVYSIIDSTF